MEAAEDLKIVRVSTAGSVDDGKSTLIGRLLYDTKSIFEDQYASLIRGSEHRGEDQVNLALLTDGLRAEREQGITIDVAYRYFATPRRRFILADTPGHAQYTRNMITGASTADAAIILIDARHGMTDQSKRHSFIASLLRIPNIVVVINKMDLVDFDEDVFEIIKESFLAFAAKLDLASVQFIPVSALLGDNVVNGSENMRWFRGIPLLEAMEGFYPDLRRGPSDLRLPIQMVVRPHQDFRGFAGRIASGSLRVGEEVALLPSMEQAKVSALLDVNGETNEVSPGSNVIVTLDRDVDVSRGDMVARPRNLPSLTQNFEALLCWMAAEPSIVGKPYVLRHTTREVSSRLEEVVYRFDISTLHRDPTPVLQLNDIGRVAVSTGAAVFLDTFEHNRNTGGFILLDPVSNNVVAAGMVTRTSSSKMSTAPAKAAQVVWLEGLSGSGKSTIADALVEKLKLAGTVAVRLDGDDLRTGLNRDLGFSPEDRTENLRRAAHVARLFSQHGNVTVCSFITPLVSDRAMIREILQDQLLEVFVDTPLAECERRDPKGHYRRARAGEIPEFTGVSAPFEPPTEAALIIDTSGCTVEEAVWKILQILTV
jgi:bifunctional enzyme CysN/CysC